LLIIILVRYYVICVSNTTTIYKQCLVRHNVITDTNQHSVTVNNLLFFLCESVFLPDGDAISWIPISITHCVTIIANELLAWKDTSIGKVRIFFIGIKVFLQHHLKLLLRFPFLPFTLFACSKPHSSKYVQSSQCTSYP
jgi:hypothetical protein